MRMNEGSIFFARPRTGFLIHGTGWQEEQDLTVSVNTSGLSDPVDMSFHIPIFEEAGQISRKTAGLKYSTVQSKRLTLNK